MSYIGSSPTSGIFLKLDDISGSFNDSTTSFALTNNSVAINQSHDALQFIVSVDGVVQEPKTAFNISGGNIVFTEAPNTNATFFAILLGETGVLNEIRDGSVTTIKMVANAVTEATIASSNVQSRQIANANVLSQHIANANVLSQHITDGNVTIAKMATGIFPINSGNLASNLILSGKTVFGAAIQEKSNVISSNVGPQVIDIDPLNNSVLFYTANSHDNSSHTVNFINLEGVDVGNTVSFVVAVTNNTNTFANINAVQVNGEACAGHERSATSNNLFISGGPAVPTGSANVDLYSFNVQKVQTSSYTVFLSKTNFS